MGREVAVLRSGRLAQTATPAVLYRAPVDLDVARFVGGAVVVRGTARAGKVDCALGCLGTANDAAAGIVDVMIRPEQIRVVHGAEDGVRADVIGHQYYGPDSVVRL